MSAIVVEAVSLSKRYGGRFAVKSLDIEVPEGSVYGLLGPNGAGKTTVLKLVTGLLRPTGGEVRLFGERWRRNHLKEVGALIETPALYQHLTGRENLAVHTRLLGLPKRRIGEVLEQVDLEEAGRKKVSSYSLGMKQRLGIAVALVGEPSLLILDEPTNGLDPKGIREMRALLHSFAQRGITVVVSSHILAEVSQVVSHVGIISNGELRYQGTLSDLVEKGQGRLELRTARADEALRIVRERFPDADRQDNTLFVPVAEEESAGLVAELSKEGIPINGVNYRRDDLESLFMRLTDREESGERTEVKA
ncbi:hypothetical protein RxyAA322_13100 [Rubrobacter xylanophilus]|uniref:ABC transporter domain-containing protein n=1 Tax=Rubrobacter xylanophilus TaxID=49319 RepID=A0A510HHH9_9ACTN|nr:ATP-binding cassette domain-containing protein [Rubrobacter xylanophilus]BBL79456.1 hypothetical protein RxyAA322_13100 [Rubrobacter xylanophilus]